MKLIPPSVNWHFWPWCNYSCKFCFAVFEDIPRQDRLSRDQALLVPGMLAEAGAQKLTFVGGEPTLCPYLGDLLTIAKDAGLVTCIVTNGTGLTEDFLDRYGAIIDWVGLSIDASDDDLHARMGRARKSTSMNSSSHLEEARIIWGRCQSRGIRMKLNTVVCSINADDDMTDLVLELRPERWKVFQVLPVGCQNDDYIDDLVIDIETFQAWVSRHEAVKRLEITMIAEANELMMGSYVMMDALGRFYDDLAGRHTYGPSIFEERVIAAWEQIDFRHDRFMKRDGLYDWGRVGP